MKELVVHQILNRSVRTHAEKVKQGSLAKFWIPDEFVFVSEIPLTSAGKVDKVRLRKSISQD